MVPTTPTQPLLAVSSDRLEAPDGRGTVKAVGVMATGLMGTHPMPCLRCRVFRSLAAARRLMLLLVATDESAYS